jgi:hypothetical protein
VLENRVLRRIFTSKLIKSQESGENCIMKSSIICYSSPNIVRVITVKMRWAWYGGDDKCMSYKILVGKPERKRPLRRPWPRWEDNIKMYLKEIVW